MTGLILLVSVIIAWLVASLFFLVAGYIAFYKGKDSEGGIMMVGVIGFIIWAIVLLAITLSSAGQKSLNNLYHSSSAVQEINDS